jgi:hypothetical protein
MVLWVFSLRLLVALEDGVWDLLECRCLKIDLFKGARGYSLRILTPDRPRSPLPKARRHLQFAISDNNKTSCFRTVHV